MCGLAGQVNLLGLAPNDLSARLSKAIARLLRRGPDDQKTWQDNRCAMAFARLAVIDLTVEAAQPMVRHGRVIAFNGEIYNYQSLRRDLQGLGYVFSSRSDTEVILAGWAAWGADLLPRLNGMFAFALWDPQQGELILARDRFGKKPMVYAVHGKEITFASDLAALGTLTDKIGGLDIEALRLFCALRYVPAPWTIRAGAQKLAAGHYLKFSNGGVRVHRWYDLAAARPPRFENKTDAQNELRRLFDLSCKERLVADVPVGAFLSGGIDSALVVASMAAQGHKVRSFTMGFRDASGYYEERPAAAALAKQFGLDHTEIEVTEGDALNALPAVFDGLDEPFADSSALPTFLLSMAIRREVTVALSGDGGDEVFAGYRKYQGELWADTYRTIPPILRKGFEAAIASLPYGDKETKFQEALRRLRRFTAYAGASPVIRQAGWASLLSPEDVDYLLPGSKTYANPADLVASSREAVKDEDLINTMLGADIALVLADDMLVKVDRMSMWASLEVRSPLLDHRVVECAAAMPGSWKLKRGKGKAILRQAFADRLPKEVFNRSKKGFEIPLAQWLQGELAELVDRACDPVMLRRQGLFDPQLPLKWKAELQSGKRDSSWELWMMVSFQEWAQRNSL